MFMAEDKIEEHLKNLPPDPSKAGRGYIEYVPIDTSYYLIKAIKRLWVRDKEGVLVKII